MTMIVDFEYTHWWLQIDDGVPWQPENNGSYASSDSLTQSEIG